MIFDVLIPGRLDERQAGLVTELDDSITDRNRERAGDSFISRLRRRRRGQA